MGATSTMHKTNRQEAKFSAKKLLSAGIIIAASTKATARDAKVNKP